MSRAPVDLSTASLGSAPDRSAPRCAVHPCFGDPCSGHGTCSCGPNATTVCTCDERFAGERCDQCAYGFHFTTYPSCSGVLCKLLPPIANGYSNGSSNNQRYPSLGKYACDPGYIFTTEFTSRTCDRFGDWSTEPIGCVGRPCAELVPPGDYAYSGDVLQQATGTVEYTNGGRYPSTATYTCNPGYRFGEDHVEGRQCLTDGLWDGGLDACFARSEHPMRANYSYEHCCPPPQGYGLRRYRDRQCWDGEWTYDACCLATPPPSCYGVQCDEPLAQSALQNGQVSLPSNDGNYPAWQAVACDPGYELNAATITALANFTSLCTAAERQALGLPVGAFTCIRSECETDASWSPEVVLSPPPVWSPDVVVTSCGGIMCQPPAAPEHGSVSAPSNGGRYPSTVDYECDAGYELRGPPVRKCAASGNRFSGWVSVSSLPSWTNMEPYCQGILCEYPAAPTDGTSSWTNGRRFPSVVTYACPDPGFALIGLDTRTCGTSGAWEGERPFCRGCGEGCGVCSAPPLAAGVLSNCTSAEACCETRCTLSCAPGYTGRASTLVCAADGTWNGTAAVCMEDCPEFPEPAAHTRVYVDVNLSAPLNYSEVWAAPLQDGELASSWSWSSSSSSSSSSSTSGSASGSWLDEPTEPAVPPSVRLPHGTARYLECSPGYVAVSANVTDTVRCVNGSFEETTLVCVPACLVPGLQPQVATNCSVSAPSGAQCHTDCGRGYTGEMMISHCLRMSETSAGWSEDLSTALCYRNCETPTFEPTVMVIGANVSFASNESNSSWANASSAPELEHGRELVAACIDGLIARNRRTHGQFDQDNETLTCRDGAFDEISFECAWPSNCPPGTADTDDDAWTPCVDCGPGFWADGQAIFCSACEKGRFFGGVRGTSQDCEACAAGRYSDVTAIVRNADCVECTAGRYATSVGNDASSDCLGCMPGKYGVVTGSASVHSCIDCGVGKYIDVPGSDAANDCIDCVVGKYLDLTGSDSADDCVECVAGRYIDTTGSGALSDCIDCAVGKYLDATGSDAAEDCISCAAGKYIDTVGGDEATDCIACGLGKYLDVAGSDAAEDCIDCVAGRYIDVLGSDDAMDCIECVVGKYVDVFGSDGADDCIECTAGRYIDVAGSDSASDCIECTPVINASASATYTCIGANNSRVSACLRGFFVVPGSAETVTDSCAPCDSMSSRVSVDSCITCLGNSTELCLDGVCARGYHTYDTTTQTCAGCIAGTFIDRVGGLAQGDCIECRAGKYLPAVASADEEDCMECAPGQISGSGSALCVNCATGRYNDISPAVSCRECAAGSYASAGSTACSVCVAGQNDHDSNATTICVNCTRGTFARPGQSGPQGCVACAAGRFDDDSAAANSAATPCAPCPLGTHQRNIGQTQCDLCGPGRYQDTRSQATCKVCLAGTYVEVNGSEAIADCIACVAGRYVNATGSGNATDCEACGNGTYAANGSDFCSPCQAGFADTDADAATLCQPCSAGSFAAVASVTCQLCVAGLADMDEDAATPCQQCGLGMYSNASALECTHCKAGTADADLNPATTCTECSNGTYAPTGSYNCASCPSGFADLDQDPSSECESCGEGVESETGLTACPVITCPRLVVRHAKVKGSRLFRDNGERTWPNNTPTVVACARGFSLSSDFVEKETLVRCQANASWDDRPACVAINCSGAPRCGGLLREACLDTINTCGVCLPGYASLESDGDGNDPCGILAILFNASLTLAGPPPALQDLREALVSTAQNASGESDVAIEFTSYTQTVQQRIRGLPGTPQDYAVAPPSTGWGAAVQQIEDAVKLAVGSPNSSVAVTQVTSHSPGRRRRLEDTYVSVQYTLISSVDVSEIVSTNWSAVFLSALASTDGPMAVYNDSVAATEPLGPLTINASSGLVISQPQISTEVVYRLTVPVSSVASSELVLAEVSAALRNSSAIEQVFDRANITVSITHADVHSAGLAHLPLPPPPPPPPCGMSFKCITAGIGSPWIVVGLAAVAFVWCMCGLCQALSNASAAKHQSKIHVDHYPKPHDTAELMEKKLAQTEDVLAALTASDDVKEHQINSLRWRVGESSSVDRFGDMTYAECKHVKRVAVKRGPKLPAIEMALQPLTDTTIHALIGVLEDIDVDTSKLRPPPHWWDAASKLHRCAIDCLYAVLGTVDGVAHCLLLTVLHSEGKIDDGIAQLYTITYASLGLRLCLSASAALYALWYVTEVRLAREATEMTKDMLEDYHRTRRRSHDERIKGVRKRMSLSGDVTALAASAHWRSQAVRPHTAPGHIAGATEAETPEAPRPTTASGYPSRSALAVSDGDPPAEEDTASDSKEPAPNGEDAESQRKSLRPQSAPGHTFHDYALQTTPALDDSFPPLGPTARPKTASGYISASQPEPQYAQEGAATEDSGGYSDSCSDSVSQSEESEGEDSDSGSSSAKDPNRQRASPRPQSAPGHIFHDFAMKTTPDYMESLLFDASGRPQTASGSYPLHSAQASASDSTDSGTESSHSGGSGSEQEDEAMSAGSEQTPLQFAERLKGGQRPQSAGSVDTLMRATGYGLHREAAFSRHKARPQSAALPVRYPSSTQTSARPRSAVPVVVSQYPPLPSERSQSVRPRSAFGERAPASDKSPPKMFGERPMTASGYISPSKARQPKQRTHPRPQSASPALVGLQARLINYFESTPAAMLQTSPPRETLAGTEDAKPSEDRAQQQEQPAEKAHLQPVHKRPISAPLKMYRDVPASKARQLDGQRERELRSVQTRAATVDREQRDARRRSQALQDAADLGKLRREHRRKALRRLRADPRAADRTDETTISEEIRRLPLDPIDETSPKNAMWVDRYWATPERPKSAPGTLATSACLPDQVADEADEDLSGEAPQTTGEAAELEVLPESSQQGCCCSRLRWVAQQCAYLACLLNPFALSAVLWAHRKHEGVTPLLLAITYNVWVIISDVPIAGVLLDYAVRRQMLTVTPQLDEADEGRGWSLAVPPRNTTWLEEPWMFVRVELISSVSLLVYIAMACTALSLCIHLCLRWLACVRCCCAGISCKCCRRKPRVYVSQGQKHERRAAAYMTAGTHEPLPSEADEKILATAEQEGGEEQKSKQGDGAPTQPGARARSAGDRGHEHRMPPERPRSAALLRGASTKRGAHKKHFGLEKIRKAIETVEDVAVRPLRPKSAHALPALHSLRPQHSTHGHEKKHVKQTPW